MSRFAICTQVPGSSDETCNSRLTYLPVRLSSRYMSSFAVPLLISLAIDRISGCRGFPVGTTHNDYCNVHVLPICTHTTYVQCMCLYIYMYTDNVSQRV